MGNWGLQKKMLQVKASQLFAVASEQCVHLTLSNSPDPSLTLEVDGT